MCDRCGREDCPDMGDYWCTIHKSIGIVRPAITKKTPYKPIGLPGIKPPTGPYVPKKLC